MLSHGKFYTIAHFFTDKVDDYWHILYPVCSVEEREKDRYLYFIDISRKALDYKGEFGDDGVYAFLGYDGKYHLHALEIAQFGLASWLAWRKSGDAQWADKALIQCRWLVKNQEENGSWLIHHKNPLDHDLPLPWTSGMANGLAISVLVRAYWFTRDKHYLEAAVKAYDFLESRVEDGGAKRYFDHDSYVYEESVKSKLEGILNGHLFAVFGIYDLSFDLPDCQKSFSDNMRNLKKILPKYDMGYWSYYDLNGEIASGFYHRLVIFQLQSLIAYDEYFLYFSNKMKKYIGNTFFALRALYAKLSHRTKTLKKIKEVKNG